jgi:signal transduction histidine kinase
MERLIGDLMDSSRLDFDGIRLEFRDVDMALLVADVVQGLRAEIGERDARIVIEPLPVIRADEWALTKVFMNLIGNALQYARPDARPKIAVRCEESVGSRRFTVADNGIGIPQKDLGRLFRRFERGSNTSGITGTGLGLHIIKEIVGAHGGTVWVESTEGKGSRFHVEIPDSPVQPGHSPVSDVQELVDA